MTWYFFRDRSSFREDVGRARRTSFHDYPYWTLLDSTKGPKGENSHRHTYSAPPSPPGLPTSEPWYTGVVTLKVGPEPRLGHTSHLSRSDPLGRGVTTVPYRPWTSSPVPGPILPFLSPSGPTGSVHLTTPPPQSHLH